MCNGRHSDENVTETNMEATTGNTGGGGYPTTGILGGRNNPDSNGMWTSPADPLDFFPHPANYPTFEEFDMALEEFQMIHPEIDVDEELLRRTKDLMLSISEKLGISPASPVQSHQTIQTESISPEAQSNPGLVAKLFPTAPQPEDFFDGEDYEEEANEFANSLSPADRISFLETLVLENAILRGDIPSPILARDIVDSMYQKNDAYLNGIDLDEPYWGNDDGTDPRLHAGHNHTTDPEDIDIHLDVIEVTSNRYVTVATVTNRQTGNVYKGASIKNPNDTNTSDLEGYRLALRRALATSPLSDAEKKRVWSEFVEQVVKEEDQPKEVAFADILEAASNQSFAGDLDEFIQRGQTLTALSRIFGH